MAEFECVEGDVLVVGGGGAGMRAAMEAADRGARVLLLTKGQIAHSGATPMACPSYQAAFAMEDDRDGPEIAFEDTCFEGRYLGDENLIHVLTHEATERAMDLERYGVRFRRKDSGGFLQIVHPGHSFERNLVIKGAGYALAAGLRHALRKRDGVISMDDVVVTRLLRNADRVTGAVAMDMRRGRLLAVRARAVILATGGYAELWRWTDTEPGLTGDGAFQAFEVGADLVDLEMMLYYPAGLCHPPEVEGTLVQYEGLLTDKYCHGQMLNGLGDPFLPATERLPVRDVMMKLMFREIEEGRATPHGGLYIDLRKSPKSAQEIREMLDRLESLPYDQLRDLGIDVLEEPIEVKPVTHYTLGGVRINEWCETSVAGLFAAGEVSGNVHGANRTSGNALAETQVFGRRAGWRAAEFARSVAPGALDEGVVAAENVHTEGLLGVRPHEVRPIEVKRLIKTVMHEHVHYRRDAAGLSAAIQTLRQIRSEVLPRMHAIPEPRVYNYEWQEALEAASMLGLAELVAASALAREESRGHHWRTDFPSMRQEWEMHTVARKGEEGYQITSAEVVRLKDRTSNRRAPDPALVSAGVLE